MHVAVRPPLAATALIGVGLLAAPAVAPMPAVQLPAVARTAQTAAVDLLASSSVFALYEQVFTAAVANAEKLGEDSALEDFVRQFVTNQVSTLTTLAEGLGATGGSIADALTTQVPTLAAAAVEHLAAGQVSDAVNSLLQIPLVVALPATDLLPALQTVLTRPLQSLVNVVNAFTADPLGAQLLLSGFIAPLISTPAAAAVAFQNVLDAAATLDPVAVATALGAAPAVIADGFLNGGYGPDLGALVSPGLTVKAGGLLSTSDLVFNPDGTFYVNTGGPIAALQQVFAKLATAITPPMTVRVAKSEVASVPDTAAATVIVATPTAPETSATTAQPEPQTDTAVADAPSVTPADPRDDEASGDLTDDTESGTKTDDSTSEADGTTTGDDVTNVEHEIATGNTNDDTDAEGPAAKPSKETEKGSDKGSDTTASTAKDDAPA
ncbi:hypothetical protein [Mycolicibacterium litorale]|uniref:PE-PGRS family protein n=1 Tax=Mycolicibacterium litorale TaxID=758802 RepID=A0AAD1IRD5_9MYCO|nr:hypothetical protein [Mycolicibacterium litorale]MCV7416929.1 hypothetical protein [Mycolicibacterium litorale]TDY04714.1 hypothetical protein BCL50_3491 [Mycolicibacterium litorale]BBY18142.1 hypothetical protein MLIT_37340 [Mycolicibacterium litorale]